MIGAKQCSKCRRVFPLDDFYRSIGTRDGRDSRCKSCKRAHVRMWQQGNADLVREKKRKAYRENAAWYRDNALIQKYGITREQYNALLARQGGKCAICRLPERTRANNGRALKDLAVDHDHETGVIRGLLCAQCNKGLGNFGESSGRIRAAAAYLQQNDQHAPLLRLMAGAG